MLSVLSKLLEKHFCFLITECLDEHHPLSSLQWGFQKGKSTTLALLSVTHDWLTQLDNKKDVCCIFFDFQKAFDTVPHKNLMDKLRQLQFHPLILKWIHSYLRNRKQHIVVNGVASFSVPVISRVPQGSVLGPLLFLIYIDGISMLKFSDGSTLSLYADDMLLYKVISSNADYIYLQHDNDRIQNWSSDNLMSFNVSKCKCMLISHKTHELSIPNSEWRIPGNCSVLQIPGHPPFLLSSNLSWSTHIDSICVKVRKLLGLLHRRFSANTNSHTLMVIFESN